MKLFIAAAAFLLPAQAMAEVAATLYKSALCTCCDDYAAFLRHNGFAVKVIATHELPQLRAKHGVSEALTGCHMTLIDGYVIEGHMPLGLIQRLLAERPNIKGISLPGMPLGVPGMPGPRIEPITVFEIAAENPQGEPRVYAVE